MIRPIVAMLAMLALGPVSNAIAADSKAGGCENPEAADILKCFSVDLSMPDSPGLQMVGLGTSDALRPTSPRAFGKAVVAGLDKEGKPKMGFALDFAPYKILAPTTSRKTYAENGLMRIAWNTQASFGVGKATDSQDKSLRVGYGLSSILWRRDTSDPVLNDTYQTCLSDRLLVINTETVPQELGGKTGTDAGLKSCYDKFTSDAWNGTGLTVGLAGAQVSSTGKWSDSSTGSTGAWVTLTYGFEDFPNSPLRKMGEIVLTWRKLGGEQVADTTATGGIYKRDSNSTSIVGRYKGSEKWNFYAEYSYQRYKSAFIGDETSRRLAAIYETKVGEGTWFTIGIGGEGGRSGGANRNFVLTGFKFGGSEKPAFL